MRIEGGNTPQPGPKGPLNPNLARGQAASDQAQKAAKAAHDALEAAKKAGTPEEAHQAAETARDAVKVAQDALDEAQAALAEARKAPTGSGTSEHLAQLEAHVETARTAATQATNHAAATAKVAQDKALQGSSYSDKTPPRSPTTVPVKPEHHVTKSMPLGRVRATSGAGGTAASFSANGDQVTLSIGGKVTTVRVDKDNAPRVLKQLKEADPTGTAPGTYAARQAILEHSGGSVECHHAFTLKEPPKAGLLPFLADRANWIPERLALQDEIVGKELGHAQALSDRLAAHGEKNVVYALRGNTAAGKTTAVKKNPELSQKVLVDGEARGAINPDPIKGQLVKAHEGRISTQQSHFEGSAMSQRVEKEMLSRPGSSLVLDKRFAGRDDIPQLLKDIGARNLKLIDLEVPLETSCVRVLTRKPGTADPLVPFGPVSAGFDGVRRHRQDLIMGRQEGAEGQSFQGVIENPKITAYALYVADEKGQPVLVAEKRDGTWFGPDTQAKQALFDKAVLTDPTEEATRVERTVIDDAFIQKHVEGLRAAGFPGAESKAVELREALEVYKGKTLGAALQAHSEQ